MSEELRQTMPAEITIRDPHVIRRIAAAHERRGRETKQALAKTAAELITERLTQEEMTSLHQTTGAASIHAAPAFPPATTGVPVTGTRDESPVGAGDGGHAA
jgi:hypothetical protein